jgi:hypothetical protein
VDIPVTSYRIKARQVLILEISDLKEEAKKDGAEKEDDKSLRKENQLMDAIELPKKLQLLLGIP